MVGVLPLYREAVGLFHSQKRLEKRQDRKRKKRTLHAIKKNMEASRHKTAALKGVNNNDDDNNAVDADITVMTVRLTEKKEKKIRLVGA